MTPIGRALMGILTTIVFVVIGVSVLEPEPRLGWVLILLAVLRGGYALWQLREGMQSGYGPPDDDDEAA